VAFSSFAFTDWFVRRTLDGLSEVAAWGALVWVGVLAVDTPSPRRGALLATLAAVIALIRPNQLPAMALLVIAYVGLVVWKDHHRRLRDGAAIAAVFAALLLLPLAHNVVFGGAWVFLPTGAGTVEDSQLSAVPSVLWDSASREIVADKVTGLLHIGGSGFPSGSSILSPFLLMQMMWLVGVGVVLWKLRGRQMLIGFTAVLWPFTFAAVHIPYDIWIYYPRHIAGFNMAAALAGLILTTHFWPNKLSTSQAIHSTEEAQHVGVV
jgi:hypothetical protein